MDSTPTAITDDPQDRSGLCPTGQVIASIIDGASERAVLVSEDGMILYRNGAADRFLFKTAPMITDILVVDDDNNNNNNIHNHWKTLDHSRIVKADGVATRSARNLHWVVTQSCTCCDKTYYTCYICSKHERVREIVDHAFDPVLTVNERGTIVTANDAACDLFEYEEGELVGHNVKKICGGGHAENHDQYMQKYQETGIQHIIGKKRELKGRRKNGTEFPCELGVQEIVDASTNQRFYCGFFKDLTIPKQHEAEIQERRDLLQGMIDASFDSMFEINEEGIIKIVNNAACAMFGYTREEFLGGNISMICGGGHAAHHDEYLKRYMSGGEKRIIGRKRQVKGRRKDGSEFDVELGVKEIILHATDDNGDANIHKDDGRKVFCGFIRDLTAQMHDKRMMKKQHQLIHGKFFSGK